MDHKGNYDYSKKCLLLLKQLDQTSELIEEIRQLNNTQYPLRYIHNSINRNNRIVQNEIGCITPASSHHSEATLYDHDQYVLKILNPFDVEKGNLVFPVSEKRNFVSQLFDEKLSYCINYLAKIKYRITNKTSKVLITGDLNSGKSTLLNCLIKDNILPTDQQPLTMNFCQVSKSSEDSKSNKEYSICLNRNVHHASSSKKHTNEKEISINQLRDYVSDENLKYDMINIICYQNRNLNNKSFINNDTLDIHLIDSPGLNRDSINTTQLFSRQEEIDVIVFVVHAENQFTLSGKEFLKACSKEKAYLFIVVNKHDLIRDKRKLKKQILKQIQELSPHTYQNNSELVHFISATDCFDFDYISECETDNEIEMQFSIKRDLPLEYKNMEKCLAKFIIEKRTLSKLAPCKNLILSIVEDLIKICSYNKDYIGNEIDDIQNYIDTVIIPLENRLESKLVKVVSDSDRIIDETLTLINNKVIQTIKQFNTKQLFFNKFSIENFNISKYITSLKNTFCSTLNASMQASIIDMNSLVRNANNQMYNMYTTNSESCIECEEVNFTDSYDISKLGFFDERLKFSINDYINIIQPSFQKIGLCLGTFSLLTGMLSRYSNQTSFTGVFTQLIKFSLNVMNKFFPTTYCNIASLVGTGMLGSALLYRYNNYIEKVQHKLKVSINNRFIEKVDKILKHDTNLVIQRTISKNFLFNIERNLADTKSSVVAKFNNDIDKVKIDKHSYEIKRSKLLVFHQRFENWLGVCSKIKCDVEQVDLSI